MEIEEVCIYINFSNTDIHTCIINGICLLFIVIAPQAVSLDVDVSNSLTSGQRMYYQFVFGSNGVTVRLTVSSGTVICYASDLIQNPNDEQGYVWKVTSSGFVNVFLDPSSLNRPVGSTLYVALEGSSSSNSFTLSATSGDRRCEACYIYNYVWTLS